MFDVCSVNKCLRCLFLYLLCELCLGVCGCLILFVVDVCLFAVCVLLV